MKAASYNQRKALGDTERLCAQEPLRALHDNNSNELREIKLQNLEE